MQGVSNQIVISLMRVADQASENIFNNYVAKATSYHDTDTKYPSRGAKTKDSMTAFDIHFGGQYNRGGSFKSKLEASDQVFVVRLDGLSYAIIPSKKLQELEAGVTDFTRIRELVKNRKYYFTLDQLVEHRELFESLEKALEDAPGEALPRLYLHDAFMEEMSIRKMRARIVDVLIEAGFKQK